jgi:hypothetical protein
MCKQANINTQSILGPSIVVKNYYTNVSNFSQVENTIFIIIQCNWDKIESNIIIWKNIYAILNGQKMLAQSTTYVVHSIPLYKKKITLQFFNLLLMEKHTFFLVKIPMFWNNSLMILQMLNVNML